MREYNHMFRKYLQKFKADLYKGGMVFYCTDGGLIVEEDIYAEQSFCIINLSLITNKERIQLRPQQGDWWCEIGIDFEGKLLLDYSEGDKRLQLTKGWAEREMPFVLLMEIFVKDAVICIYLDTEKMKEPIVISEKHYQRSGGTVEPLFQVLSKIYGYKDESYE